MLKGTWPTDSLHLMQLGDAKLASHETVSLHLLRRSS